MICESNFQLVEYWRWGMAVDVIYNPKVPVFDELGMGFQIRHFLQIGPFTNQWRSSKGKIVAALFETIPFEMQICVRYVKKID